MTNKRFIKDPIFEENTLLPIMYNKNRLFLNDVVELLNDLHQENQSLKESQDVKEFSALFNQTIALKREIKDLKEENEQLRQQLNQKEEEEKLYAREIVELNKTKNEMLNFKELGGDY